MLYLAASETLFKGHTEVTQTKTKTDARLLGVRNCLCLFGLNGGPPADRTRDTLIKSQVLHPFENTEKHRPDRGLCLYSLPASIHNLLEDRRTQTQKKDRDSAKP